MKRRIAFLLTAALVVSFAGCTRPGAVTAPARSISPPAASATPSGPPASRDSEAPQTPGTEAPETEAPTVPALVFDAEIEDPVSESLRAGGGIASGKAALRLTLYETSPGVYSGAGTLTRTVTYSMGGHNVEADYVYRTGALEAKPGAAAEVAVLVRCDYLDEFPIGEPELGNYSYEKRFSAWETFQYTLKLDGGSAHMLLTAFGKQFDFPGKAMRVPAGSGPDALPEALNGKCLYINSTYTAGKEEGGGEYRAMLVAKKAEGGNYAGELCLYGTGDAAAFTDGAASFALLPFDEEAYKAAGGRLSGAFDAYGVIRRPESDYFVLIDGGTPLLEPAGGGMAFFGSLLPEEQYAQAAYEAAETERLMRTLYDGDNKAFDMAEFMERFKGKDMNDPEVRKEIEKLMPSMVEKAKPAWYPDWLLPKPVKLMGGGEWAEVASPDAMLFKTYCVQYVEDVLQASKVYDSYRKQMSGKEGFDTRATEFDPGNHKGEGVILFRQGAYRIWIEVSQQILVTVVTVRIV